MPRLFMVRKKLKQRIEKDGEKEYFTTGVNAADSHSDEDASLPQNKELHEYKSKTDYPKDKLSPYMDRSPAALDDSINHIMVTDIKPGYEPFATVPENIRIGFRPYVPQPEIHPLQVPSVSVETINLGFGIKNPLMRPCFVKGKFSGNQTNFICRLCGQMTTTKRKLQRHLQEHSEVKKYFCSICGKGFNDTFDLKRHTRTHTGVRPYPCETCGRSFTQRCTMEAHVSRIHGQEKQYAFKERRTKLFVCEICGFSSSKKEDYLNHLERGHVCPEQQAIV